MKEQIYAIQQVAAKHGFQKKIDLQDGMKKNVKVIGKKLYLQLKTQKEK